MRDVLMIGVVLATLASQTPAAAHEGGAHAMGTIKGITSDRILLTTKEGKVVELPLTAETRILRGQRAVTAGDVRPGERAVVHSAMRGGKLEATEVRVANAPR